MAKHARLIAPLAPPREEWPWHTVKSKSVSARLFIGGGRRFDAETYLSSGFAIRNSIERNAAGWKRFGDIADAWVPPRLKATLVSKRFGAPYLNTSQVFDIRPRSRKWLSLDKTPHSERRFAKQGSILVMASANVGRSIVTSEAHEGCLLSHHFMRVEPKESNQRGWIYAFLRSPQGWAMMSGAQYASVIRHIEPKHLKELPVPQVDVATAADFNQRVQRLLALRNQSYRQTLEAERLFEEAFGLVIQNEEALGFVSKASAFSRGRRRLEGNFYSPRVMAILARIQVVGNSVLLGDVCERVWWLNRFKRVFGEDGIPYRSADELFSINSTESKSILVDLGDPRDDFKVNAGWIVMARSGQTYGLNGSAMLLTEQHESQFISDDLIRIIPDTAKIRSGYLLTAITHPTLGRPLVIRTAYGTSIPHIDPTDVRDIRIVRFDAATESAIADLAEASAAARAEADVLERELSIDAGRVIEAFISGDTLKPMRPVPSHRERHSRPVTSLAEHGRVRLLKGMPGDHLRAGATGTIVHVYAGGKGLEVEFDAGGKSPRVLTLNRKAVEPLAD